MVAVTACTSSCVIMNYKDALGRAALNLEEHYFVSGESRAPAIRISFADEKKKDLCLPRSLTANEDVIQGIYANAAVSAFGHNGETVLDETVRKAKEIRREEINFHGLDILRHGDQDVLERIRQALVPDSSKVIAELDKMNIYQEGGHFESHYDTPRGGGFFGTLVVVLPSMHVGGEILIEKPGSSKESYTTEFAEALIGGGSYSKEKYAFRVLNKSKERTDWSGLYPTSTEAQTLLKDLTPKGILQWVAFFGDCQHKVLSVHFGSRFSLAYTLKRVDDFSLQARLLSTEDLILLRRAQNFEKLLMTALQDRSFLPQGGQLGFACIHLYEDHELPGTDEVLTADTTAQSLNLKGADALVCIAGARLGLNVTVVRLVTEDCAGLRWSVKRIPDVLLIKKFGRMGYWSDGRCRTRLVDGEHVGKYLGGDGRSIDDTMWCVELPGLSSFCCLPPQDPCVQPIMARFVEQIVHSDTGYYGNEAGPTDFYTHAAILIEFPPVANNHRMEYFSGTVSSHDNLSKQHLIGLKKPAGTRIEEINSFQLKLCGKRKYCSSQSSMEDYCSMTLPQLKTECRSLGLKVGGTKADLIARLQSNT